MVVKGREWDREVELNNAEAHSPLKSLNPDLLHLDAHTSPGAEIKG